MQGGDSIDGKWEENSRESRRSRSPKDEDLEWEYAENTRGSSSSPDFLNRNYKGLFLIPFILILTGVLIMAIAEYPNPPDPEDYDDSDEYRDDLDNFNNIIGDIHTTGELFFTFAIIVLSFLFFMAPFTDRKLNPVLKIAMLALGVIIIRHFLSGGFNLSFSLG